MTVSELIEELKKHPPYMPVVFPSVEPEYSDSYGYSSINSVEKSCSHSGPQAVVISGPGELL